MISQPGHDIQQLVHSIRSHGPNLDALSKRLRTPRILGAFNKWDHKSWCISVAGDTLVRIRLLTENNFTFIETMGLVAVARYIFELSIWLRLFELDPRYGLVYFHRLLTTQRRYYEDTKAQLEREVDLLKSFEAMEAESLRTKLQENNSFPPGSAREEKLSSRIKELRAEVDAVASRHFSIYAKEAQTNGYGFQAHLVATKAIPEVDRALKGIAFEREQFDRNASEEVKDLISARWNWRQMAVKVNRCDEYDYIYSFASKLLHAEPVSITTDQKNLEPAEVEVFLKFIDVTIADVLGLARKYA